MRYSKVEFNLMVDIREEINETNKLLKKLLKFHTDQVEKERKQRLLDYI